MEFKTLPLICFSGFPGHLRSKLPIPDMVERWTVTFGWHIGLVSSGRCCGCSPERCPIGQESAPSWVSQSVIVQQRCQWLQRYNRRQQCRMWNPWLQCKVLLFRPIIPNRLPLRYIKATAGWDPGEYTLLWLVLGAYPPLSNWPRDTRFPEIEETLYLSMRYPEDVLLNGFPCRVRLVQSFKFYIEVIVDGMLRSF